MTGDQEETHFKVIAAVLTTISLVELARVLISILVLEQNPSMPYDYCLHGGDPKGVMIFHKIVININMLGMATASLVYDLLLLRHVKRTVQVEWR